MHGTQKVSSITFNKYQCNYNIKMSACVIMLSNEIRYQKCEKVEMN